MNFENPTYSKEGQPGQDIKVLKLIESYNIAEKLDEDQLGQIGSEAKAAFDADDSSREIWLRETEEWLKLAKQVREIKHFPWKNASNIKYPLISIAAIQFAARAYPTLVPSDGNIVRARIIGKDPDGKKAEKADRVSKYMSWQLIYDMPRWEEEMDQLLVMLPVCGMMFKKTYYSKKYDKVLSELVYPENFVVHYWAKDLQTAERYSEILYISKRELKEKQAYGEYLDVDLGDPSSISMPLPKGNEPAARDIFSPYKIIQQATWLDLDEDGIQEPYTVVFHYDSGKVLKIVPRFTPKDIVLNDEGKIACIKAHCYYTKFSFIPNPDGSFYDFGFGHLLGPINESVNTLVNQLVDSGTLNNLQAGFIGKGIKMKMGDTPLGPGEWRAVNAVGDDLRKQLVPLPTKDPSSVLLQLLNLLISSGKELASVAEIFVGKMPGQNTPATTTMATIEQGMKVFTAIYKRVYRSLEKEFKKIFELNSEYLDESTYVEVLDSTISREDFDYKSYDVCPAADPAAASQQEKLMKAQALLELLPLGTLDPIEVTIRVLQAQDQPNWEKLIPGMAQGNPQIQKQQDPKLQEMQQNMQIEREKAAMKSQELQQKMALTQRSKEAELAQKQKEAALDLQRKMMENRLAADAAMQKQRIFMADARNKVIANAMKHRQQLAQEKEKLAQKNGESGKPTR